MPHVLVSSGNKPDSGIAGDAFVFVVAKDTDSRLWMILFVAYYIEPFSVTVVLQGALRTKQSFPRVTAHGCGAELPVSDQ